MVVEVHGIQNRLLVVQELLREHGFAVTTVHQKPTLEDGFLHYVPAALQLYMVYATKSDLRTIGSSSSKPHLNLTNVVEHFL